LDSAVELSSVGLQRPALHGRGFGFSDLELSIQVGEQIALIGPSGAGKTTLLAMLALQLNPDRGQVRVFDTDAWSLRERERHAQRKRLFLAPQVPPLPPRQRVVASVLAGLLPHMSLLEAVASLLYPRRAAEAAACLSQLGLEHKLWERVDALSGGERQRVSIARMLASKAELLLADEPLSALDPNTARRTIEVLIAQATARKATLVCSLHQVDLALTHFRRVIGLRDGCIVFDLPAQQVNDARIAELYAGHEDDARKPVAEPAVIDPLASTAVERCF
jgi:phosphonate transport system ATP-binding protein